MQEKHLHFVTYIDDTKPRDTILMRGRLLLLFTMGWLVFYDIISRSGSVRSAGPVKQAYR